MTKISFYTKFIPAKRWNNRKFLYDKTIWKIFNPHILSKIRLTFDLLSIILYKFSLYASCAMFNVSVFKNIWIFNIQKQTKNNFHQFLKMRGKSFEVYWMENLKQNTQRNLIIENTKMEKSNQKFQFLINIFGKIE